MKKPDGQTVFLGSAVLLAVTVVVVLLFFSSGKNGQADRLRSSQSELTLGGIPFDGRRSYEMLKLICELGPRYSGSDGMRRQQDLLQQHFEGLGGKVEFQRFRTRDPRNGAPVEMTNLIVRWHPERSSRVLLCAHYDTRPYPDQDPNVANRRRPFIGANDGASGVAVLAELARWMPKLNSSHGVDFVLFDGEEFIFDDRRDTYFLGSRYFAQDYAAAPPGFSYRVAVLLDMVGDADLQLYQEKNSVRSKATKPFVEDIWKTAARLGVREFIARPKHEIRDDHLMLQRFGKIPALDIIDFDYGRRGRRQMYWHTTEDTPDKCSSLSLAKVGWVVLEWLNQLP